MTRAIFRLWSLIKVGTSCEDHLLYVITLSTLSVSPDSNDLFLGEIRHHLTWAVWDMLSTLHDLFMGDKCSWINLKHWAHSVDPTELYSQGPYKEQSADYQIEMKWLARSEKQPNEKPAETFFIYRVIVPQLISPVLIKKKKRKGCMQKSLHQMWIEEFVAYR